jgi:amino acid transporter
MKAYKMYQKIALLTFCGETLLCYGYVITRHEVVVFLGFFYTLFALLIHGMALIALIHEAIYAPENRRQRLKDFGVLVLNIPVVACYLLLYFLIQTHTR